MAKKGKAAKDKARADKRKEMRKGSEARRISLNRAYEGLRYGEPTALNMATLLNAEKSLSKGAQAAGAEIAALARKHGLAERIDALMCTAAESIEYASSIVPGTLLMASGDPEDTDHVACAWWPLALESGFGFDPLEDAFDMEPGTPIAAWVVGTEDVPQPVFVAARIADGRQALFLVLKGEWAQIWGEPAANRILQSMVEFMFDENHSDAEALRTAKNLFALRTDDDDAHEEALEADGPAPESLLADMSNELSEIRRVGHQMHHEFVEASLLFHRERTARTQDAAKNDAAAKQLLSTLETTQKRLAQQEQQIRELERRALRAEEPTQAAAPLSLPADAIAEPPLATPAEVPLARRLGALFWDYGSLFA